MPRKVFVAGEILTAADVNTNLMDQAVMVFDDSAARGSAIPTPSEGMVTYLKDINQVQAYDGAAFASVGTILQVVSTTKTDTFSTTSTSFVDVTGLTATITPSSSSSKVLVIADVSVSQATASDGRVQFLRGATVIPASIDVAHASSTSPLGNVSYSFGHTYLDAPSSTSALTYKMQARVLSGGTLFVNRRAVDTSFTVPSSITLIEVAG